MDVKQNKKIRSMYGCAWIYIWMEQDMWSCSRLSSLLWVYVHNSATITDSELQFPWWSLMWWQLCVSTHLFVLSNDEGNSSNRSFRLHVYRRLYAIEDCTAMDFPDPHWGQEGDRVAVHVRNKCRNNICPLHIWTLWRLIWTILSKFYFTWTSFQWHRLWQLKATVMYTLM